MSTSSQLTAACYLKATKELLKQRGITYPRLAEALGCSLPTVKRLLNKPTVPLDRLLEVAEVAGFGLDEIGRRADRLRPQHHIFSEAQDALFTERPEVLAYLQELIGGQTPDQIAARYDLDARSSNLYQRHLEDVGLVQRRPRNRVKLLVRPPVGFGPGSRYLKKEAADFLTAVTTTVVNADPSEPDRFALLKPVFLTRADYRALLDGLKRLVDRYAALSEGPGAAAKASPWQIAVACGPGAEPSPRTLPRITR